MVSGQTTIGTSPRLRNGRARSAESRVRAPAISDRGRVRPTGWLGINQSPLEVSAGAWGIGACVSEGSPW